MSAAGWNSSCPASGRGYWDVPVLGAIRQDALGWLEDIRNHPKVQLITVTEQNRNDLPLQLAEYYAPFIKPIKEE